ncbi:MAG: ATP-binding protein [Candidatus Vecturithrix sp.]|jgi:signal transduction histidine kinase/DNA-binding NarL/FixJ family response regulator|nr:ATP-binding protein [Candidatus Vecturithrix sp.]
MNWGYILCIDDDLMELNTLANQLQEEFSRSHIVYKAESAEEATLIMDMLQAAQKQIELIICDQTMPGISGSAFLDAVHQVNPEIMKILLITPQENISPTYLLSRATVHNVLEKPWRREHLILTVESLLKLYSFSQHVEELQEISLQFGPIFDLPQLLRKAIAYIEKMTAAWKVAIAITDGKSIVPTLYISNASERIENQPQKENVERLFREIFLKRKEPIVFTNAYDNKYLKQFDIPGWYKANHVVCIPLWRDTCFFGVMYMADKISGLPFFREDIMSAKIIAYQLISGLENIRLTEEKLRMDRFSTVGNMASEIIHDLKGPMTNILGFAELLALEKSSYQEQTQYAHIITTEVERMVEMVEEILEFSRGDKIKLNLQPCDIDPFISEVVEMLKRTFNGNKIHFMTKLHCKRPIYADKEKLKRVFFNIASNAKEALQEEGKFSINTYSHNQTHIEFRIADSGAGIPEHVKENIFEPFVTYGKKRGTGLGMSIARKIVTDHGGNIWVESEEGTGTIFYFTIPFVRNTKQ